MSGDSGAGTTGVAPLLGQVAAALLIGDDEESPYLLVTGPPFFGPEAAEPYREGRAERMTIAIVRRLPFPSRSTAIRNRMA